MKEKKYLVLSTVILIVLLVFGVSYSFYKARIEGDTKSISLKTKGIYLLYKGDLNLVSGYIEPGWSVTKTFTIENQGSEIEKYNIYIKDLVNTFVTEGYLQYKITSNNGYNMSEYKDIPKAESKTDTVLAYSVPINPKEEQEYTIELIYKDTEEDQSEDMGKILSGILNIQEGTTNSVPLLTAILRDNPIVSERTDFSVVNTETTTGTIYQTNKTEDGSTVYYYSGNTTNNWVKFGKFQNDIVKYRGYYSSTSTNFRDYITMSECTSATSYNVNCSEYKYANAGEDMYWRIIRTNENKSVRLLYVGNNPETENGFIGLSKYNDDPFSLIYSGYMFGTSTSLESNRTNENSSTIKNYIDNWYQNNLLTNYDRYINKAAIYCNDRSVKNNLYSTSNIFRFGALTRLDNSAPTYKCGGDGTGGLFESTQAVEDKFSASTTGGGNGQLTYPIALMTADEITFAGGKYDTGKKDNNESWYFVNASNNSLVFSSGMWTMSPNTWDTEYIYINGIRCNDKSGLLGYITLEGMLSVRPTISLESCVIVSGTGTSDDPYVVDYEGSCK